MPRSLAEVFAAERQRAQQETGSYWDALKNMFNYTPEKVQDWQVNRMANLATQQAGADIPSIPQQASVETLGVNTDIPNQVPLMMQGLQQNMEANQPFPKQEAVSQQPGAASQPAAYQQLQQSLEAQIRQGIAQRQADIQNTQDLKSALMTGYSPQLDLSPLMSLIKSETGADIAYQAPQTATQKLGQAQKLEQAISAQKRGVTQDQISLLKSKMANEAAKLRALKTGTKLGAEEKKAVSLVDTGIGAIQDMRAALGAGQDVWQLPGQGDNDFTFAQKRFSEAIGRLHSGGAINKDELKTFKSLTPGFFDSPMMRQRKLDEMEELLKKRMDITLGKSIKQSGEPSQNDKALMWAQANPNDPRAAKILAKLGM